MAAVDALFRGLGAGRGLLLARLFLLARGKRQKGEGGNRNSNGHGGPILSRGGLDKRLAQGRASGYRGAVNRSLKYAVAIAALIGLAGCGNMAELRPAPGQSLPVKPLMASATPTAEELLTPPAYANPDRVDELMRRSAPRRSDRFDLPPPSGSAPAVPVQTMDEDTGPVTDATPITEPERQ